MTNTPLRVPRADNATVKRLGARWDPTRRQWYVPADRDPTPFAPWLAPVIPDDGPSIRADIVLLPIDCWRCGGVTWPVAGLLLHPADVHGYECPLLPEDDGYFLQCDWWSADAIATACPDQILVENGAGPLRWRTTRNSPNGYVFNTCRQCGATLSSWPIHDALGEYQAEGGQRSDLPHISAELPHGALDWLSARELAQITE